jgi:hypothetical protein
VTDAASGYYAHFFAAQYQQFTMHAEWFTGIERGSASQYTRSIEEIYSYKAYS